jgi:phytoene dehydrogenase-like protein
VKPLLLSALEQGVEVILNHAVKQIITKNNKIEGVWIYDNETFLLRKIEAKIVVLNVPVYDAYPSLLKDKMLTENELKYIKDIKESYTGDLSCYFLLEKDTLKDLPGHFHAFDVTRGMPTYIGEMCKQAEYGAIVPEGCDYLQIYIPGGRAGGYLKYKGDPHDLPYEKLEKAKEKMLKVVDKFMIPGFKDKIIHESITWSPNFGRYCQMAFETNLEVKSDLIEGLYFASDSVDCKCIGNLGLDKCGEISIKCINKIVEDTRIEQSIQNLS